MSNIVPFGKHKGQPIEQLLTDRNYVDWLLGQSWFQEKYVTIYNVVTGGGNEPVHTPEHNRMQMKFLDWNYRHRFIRLCMPIWRCKAPVDEIGKERNAIKFEISGIDVAIHQSWTVYPSGYMEKTAECERLQKTAEGFKDCYCTPRDKHRTFKGCGCEFKAHEIKSEENKIRQTIYDATQHHRLELAVELKPTIGDDFPEVMRQIKRRSDVMRRTAGGSETFFWYEPNQMLVVGEYTGVGATVEQFVEFFRNENIVVMFENEIDAFREPLLLPPPY